MLPFGDEQRLRKRPIVTLIILLANLTIFIYYRFLSPQLHEIIKQYGLNPQRFFNLFTSDFLLFLNMEIITLFTSIFLHADIMHILTVGD